MTPVTPHRNIPLNITRLAEMSQAEAGAGLVRPVASSVSGGKQDKYLGPSPSHPLQVRTLPS